MPGWPYSHYLPVAPFGGFLVKVWVHTSRSTTTNLERHWSANNFLSICSNISAWRLIKMCRTSSPKIASADGWEGNIRVIARGKKGYSGGEIELKERRAEFEICKNLAWSGWGW